MLILLTALCCSAPATWPTIPARGTPSPLYRACVPPSWKQITHERNTDTRTPNCSFQIEEITIHVHSFPNRIPPQAQVDRWRRQLQPQTEVCRPLSRAGFSGLYFEADGSTLAWAMQLDPDHYSTLHYLADTPDEKVWATHMASDYTIKITGPADQIARHKTDLLHFGNTFELIQEIPRRL